MPNKKAKNRKQERKRKNLEIRKYKRNKKIISRAKNNVKKKKGGILNLLKSLHT